MTPVRHLATAILPVCLALAISILGPSPQSLAQEGPEVRGAMGPIDKQALLEALERQKDGGPKVAGYIVNGRDVVDILRQGEVPVELRDCVIEDGLDFSDLSVVSDPIAVENCEIRSTPSTRALSTGTSIYARGTRFDGQVLVRSSSFAGPADLTDAVFRQKAIFPNSQFPEGASFAGVHFSDAAHFSRSHFNSVQFDSASFDAEAAFRRAVFDESAHFDRATFTGRADFRQAVFRSKQSFAATFQSTLRFDGSQFEDDADFSGPTAAELPPGAIFEQMVNFSGARFKGSAYFSDQAFPAEARFDEAQFGEGARFAQTYFHQRASFRNTQFLGESDFYEARFGDDAYFIGANFRGPSSFRFADMEHLASFRGAQFDHVIELDSIAFRESADFQGTSFRGPLSLTGADFGAYADFRDARIPILDLNSVHNPTILRSRLDMRGARIGQAHLQEVIFEADVDFSDAVFGLLDTPERLQGTDDLEIGTTILRFATFEADVFFTRARFAGRLAMENVRFQRIADFTDADFGGLARDGAPSFALSYVDFGDLRLQWPQLPKPRHWVQSRADAIPGVTEPLVPAVKPEPISRTLADLEEHFRAANLLADANAAYFEKKLAELREVRSGGWDWTRLHLEAEWIFWGLVCGYGTKLWWALGWALLVNAIFSLIYWSSATVTREPHPAAKEEFSFRLRLLDLPKHYATDRAGLPVKPGRLRKLIDSLRVSSVILFKIGYRDTTLGGHVGPLPVAYLVALEWALGFYLLAALTVTLANTQPLINRLISGVF